MIAVSSLILASCTKEKPDAPTKSNLKELINIEIRKNDNVGYAQDGFIYKKKDNVYVTVAMGVYMSKVKMDLEYFYAP